MARSPLSIPTLIIFMVSSSLSSCSQTPPKPDSSFRIPASDFKVNLDEGLLKSATQILSDVRGPRFNSDSCVRYLDGLQKMISKVNPSQISEVELEDDTLALVETLWDVRVAIHSRISEISAASGESARPCVDEIRSTLRLIRFVEDYLAERKLKIRPVDPSEIAFQNQIVPMISTTRTPDYLFLKTGEARRDHDFRSGDILVTRGNSFLSATISRIGDIDSQFSHVVLINVSADEKDQFVPTADGIDHRSISAVDPHRNIYTLESYAGKGVLLYHLKYALKNENARILHLRPKNQKLAKKAAHLMFERTKKAVESGRPIPYDYELNFNEHSEMSCAEVAQAAFEDASQGDFKIPQFPSVLTSQDSFLERFGMKPGMTFTPGDLEVDSRFEIVAEWRDLRLTRESRIKDAILTQMLKWVNVHGYKLKDTFRTQMAGAVWNTRRSLLWPLVKKLPGITDFSREIPKDTLKSLALMNEVGEIFHKYLKEMDRKHEEKTGWPMTYQDLYDAMDVFRKKDLALYSNRKTRKKALFHAAFGPSEPAKKQR